MVAPHLIPQDIQDLYEIHEWRNACSVLHGAHPAELGDIFRVLRGFQLLRSEVIDPGRNKSKIASRIDGAFYDLDWHKRRFKTRITVDEDVYDAPTHEVDCFKNGVALEVEWNNKDPFFDRDLNNFRQLFELRAISVGVIITRCTELQLIFASLGKGDSYGNSTTHMTKLLPRLEGGAGGGCPVLAFGISAKLYVED